MRPEMIARITRKQFFGVTDVCNWKINSQTLMCVIGAFTGSTL